MPPRNSFLVSLALLLVTATAWAAVQTAFYVAPSGSDANPGTEAKPFATIEKARQAVRAVNKEMTGDIVVVLRGGIYPIDRTIAFDADDSGTGGHNVIYRAQAGETPIISGGKPVVGWQAGPEGTLEGAGPGRTISASCTSTAIGRRGPGARRPPDSNLPAKTATRPRPSTWPTGRIPAIWSSATPSSGPTRGARCRASSGKATGRSSPCSSPTSPRPRPRRACNVATPPDSRCYIENALELLDEPGEWYLDRTAKTVYYMPRQGEDMTKAEVIAPAVEKLVELRGTLDRPVHNIQFRGHHVRARQLAAAQQDRLCRRAGELPPGLEESDEARRRADRRAQRVRQEPVERRLPRGQVDPFRAMHVHQAGQRRDRPGVRRPGQRDRRAAVSTTSRARPFRWATCSRTTTIPTTRARSSRTTPS